MVKKDIKAYNLQQLKQEMLALGEKEFRAKQIYEWIHKKQIEDFKEMTNISEDFKEKLKERFYLVTLKPLKIQVSKLDGTTKYLFELSDGSRIESVWMKYHHGNSVCISSQAGCRMGCRFCASTLDGLTRSLEVSEMLDQIYRIQRLTKERVDNVVVMGMGEPFDNYENLLRFIELLTDENGLNISQRNLTISTCGLTEKIRELAEEKLQITLAISLHASNDDLRKQLMPVANRYSMKELMEACQYYFKKTGRRITFEYSLIHEVNDKIEYAHELAGWIRHMNCHVNLIPVNPIKERDFKQSQKKEILNFKNKLENYGINGTIRREMGGDIDGACGQLRKSYHNEQKEKENESCGCMGKQI